MIYPIVVSVFLGMAIMPLFIPLLIKLKASQTVREEGPKTHLKKNGTPTMGGIVIILTIVISMFLSMCVYHTMYQIRFSFYEIFLLVFPLISFGLIGFIDDYLIVVKKNNKGLSPLKKLLLQIGFASVYFFIYLEAGFSTTISLFNLSFDFKWFYGIVILLIIVSSSNAVNLTDGLDGLSSGLLVIAFLSFMVLAKDNKNVSLFCLVIVGALIAFLFFNYYPSKIMMGDTGSLALGATLGSVAILLKCELLLLIIGFVFVMETLSVILQVSYYKKTRGKRLFKMTPLHHHFELSGMKETNVVLMFYAIGLLFGVLGLYIGGAI